MAVTRIVVLALAIAAATYFLGWMSVPALGVVYAIAVRKRSAPGEAALAALLGWGVLMARVAIVPAFTTLLDRLSGIFPMPGVAVVVVALVFAMLLAWSAARVITGLVVREPKSAN